MRLPLIARNALATLLFLPRSMRFCVSILSLARLGPDMGSRWSEPRVSTMKFRGVLWNLDGTLVDSEPLHDHATQLALQSSGVPSPPSVLGVTTGMEATDLH